MSLLKWMGRGVAGPRRDAEVASACVRRGNAELGEGKLEAAAASCRAAGVARLRLFGRERHKGSIVRTYLVPCELRHAPFAAAHGDVAGGKRDQVPFDLAPADIGPGASHCWKLQRADNEARQRKAEHRAGSPCSRHLWPARIAKRARAAVWLGFFSRAVLAGPSWPRRRARWHRRTGRGGGERSSGPRVAADALAGKFFRGRHEGKWQLRIDSKRR